MHHSEDRLVNKYVHGGQENTAWRGGPHRQLQTAADVSVHLQHLCQCADIVSGCTRCSVLLPY